MEIENAVTTLPAHQQQSLLVWLQKRVATNPVREAKSGTSSRETWLQRLAERRARGRTGKTGTSLQQIIDDLRGD